MATRSRRVVRSRGARRLTDWGFLLPTGPLTIAANTFVLAGSISQALFGESTPLTLVRTRGFLHVSSDQAAATEDQLCTIGVAIVKESARLAGAGSLPDPFADGDDSVWQTWNQLFTRTTFASGIGFDASAGAGIEIDSKSMRKIDTGESLVLMVANNSTTHGISVLVGLRFLFKLH